MPPCAMCEEALLAPEQKSPRSTNKTFTPFKARSRKTPIPLMPPPMISTGTLGLFLRAERASLRFIFFGIHHSTQSNVRVTAFFQPEYNFFRNVASIAGSHSFSLPQFRRNSL